eukprot:103534-Pelagomonas_calceolata.AAC.4
MSAHCFDRLHLSSPSSELPPTAAAAAGCFDTSVKCSFMQRTNLRISETIGHAVHSGGHSSIKSFNTVHKPEATAYTGFHLQQQCFDADSPSLHSILRLTPSYCTTHPRHQGPLFTSGKPGK